MRFRLTERAELAYDSGISEDGTKSLGSQAGRLMFLH
jgi:hypothetical protein